VLYLTRILISWHISNSKYDLTKSSNNLCAPCTLHTGMRLAYLPALNTDVAVQLHSALQSYFSNSYWSIVMNFCIWRSRWAPVEIEDKLDSLNLRAPADWLFTGAYVSYTCWDERLAILKHDLEIEPRHVSYQIFFISISRRVLTLRVRCVHMATFIRYKVRSSCCLLHITLLCHDVTKRLSSIRRVILEKLTGVYLM
jgi:hypothetical protein